MIDLTPLDVRNKRGDFKRQMRGYEPREVDVFLELVAERLESLVRENIQLKERTVTLLQQVESQAGREQAVQDALVTAQSLRADIQAQSRREADHVLREAEAEARRQLAAAETEARRLLAEAETEVRARIGGIERRFEGALDGLTELERRRTRFLKDFRSLLERELEVVTVEQDRKPLEDRTIDLDLGAWWSPPKRSRDGVLDSSEAGPASSAPDEAGTPEPGEDGASMGDSTAHASVEQPDPSRASEETAGAAGQREPVPPEAADEDSEAGSTAENDSGPTVASASQNDLPTELETPSFAKRPSARRRDPSAGPYDDLAAAMEAEALAQAGSEVVEVTGQDGDPLLDVPRLEEVLAEAGSELVEVESKAPRRAQKIRPPSQDENGSPATGPDTDRKPER